jgi:hypothetical protein
MNSGPMKVCVAMTIYFKTQAHGFESLQRGNIVREKALWVTHMTSKPKTISICLPSIFLVMYFAGLLVHCTRCYWSCMLLVMHLAAAKREASHVFLHCVSGRALLSSTLINATSFVHHRIIITFSRCLEGQKPTT